MKAMVTLLVVGAIAAMIVGVHPVNAFEEGQTWGYKWVTTWKDALEENSNNTTFKGDVNGKSVNMFFVKYVGNKGNAQEFHYEGVYYSYGYVTGKFSHKDNIGSMNSTVNIKEKSIWINYQGNFTIVKAVKHEIFREESYYGIKNLTVHVYTKKPLNMNMKIEQHYEEVSNGKKGSISMQTELKGTINMYESIIFKEPIPYIPENSTSVTVDTDANYTGHWDVNTQGYADFKGSSQLLGTSNSNFDLNKSLNKNVNGDFNGTVRYVVVFMDKHGNEVERCGIPENIPFAITSIFPSTSSSNSEISPSEFIKQLLLVYHNAKFQGSFYTSIKLNEIPGNINVDFTSHTYSQSVSPKEVKSVENNAPAEYGSYNENSSIYTNTIIWGITAAVAISVIVIAVVLLKRKNKT